MAPQYRNLIVILAVLWACISKAKIIHPYEPTNPYFRIHTVLDPDEEEKFLAQVLPKMTEYVRYAESRGLRLPVHPLPLYITPNTKITRPGLAEDYYGPSVQTELQASLEKIRNAIKHEDIDPIVKEIEASFPGFIAKNPLAQDLYRRSAGLDKVKGSLIRNLETHLGKMAVGTFVPPLRNDGGGWYRHGLMHRAPAVFLVYESPHDGSAGFLKLDVALHEISHSFHWAAWDREGDMRTKYNARENYLKEIFADLLGSVFLGNPQHNIFFDIVQKKILPLRDMSRPSYTSLSRDTTDGKEGHKGGQGVRRLLWTLYEEVGRDNFFDAFAKEIGNSYYDMAMRPPVSGTELFEDETLEKFVSKIATYRLVNNFVRRVLSHFPKSKTHQQVDAVMGHFDAESARSGLSSSRTVARHGCPDIFSYLNSLSGYNRAEKHPKLFY